MSKIDFSAEEIEAIIKHSITGPHKDLLAEAIIGLMDSDFKMGALLKAALGTKRECDLPLKDEYYVNFGHVSNYMFDEVKMREKGLIDSSDKMKCTLLGFNPWAANGYHILYKYLDSSGKEQEASYAIGKSSLEIVEEFPEDFTDEPF